MINMKLVYSLLDSSSIRILLGVPATLGFAALLDFMLILEIGALLGPWITLGILALSGAVCVFAAYRIVEARRLMLIEAVNGGRFDESLFTGYITGLTAGLFLIIPGVINTALGGILLIRAFSAPLGNRLIRTAGIDWGEAYEYLRLDRVHGTKS